MSNEGQQLPFCVVQFEDTQIEAIPSVWITELANGKAICRWPVNTKNFQILVRTRALPEQEWQEHDCQILKYYNTLLEARRKTLKIENDSSTSDDEKGRGCRKARPTALSLSSLLDEASTSYKAPSASTSSELDETLLNMGEIVEEKNIDVDILQPIVNAISGLQTRLQNIEGRQELILEEIRKLNVSIKEGGLRDGQKRFMFEEIAADGSTSLECLPLTSTAEINEFEVELESKDIFQKYVQHLKIHMAPRSDVSIRKCLESLYSAELAKQCAWTSAKGNFSVKDLKQIGTIEGLVRKYHPNLTKDDFKTHISNWFRRSGTRLNRQKKPNENVTEAATE